MKATVKNVIIAVALILMVTVILTAVDKASDMPTSASKTALKVCVVDLDNNPVHNAEIRLDGRCFYTDNNGNSPLIELESLGNCYDQSITDWHTQTVVICKKGYVSTVVLNCVVFDSQTRKLTVKIYPIDQSNLPYVCYVETPPDDYVNQLINQPLK